MDGKPTVRACDVCGARGRKIHRIHKGVSHCANCYAREFRSEKCSGCGIATRVHRLATAAPQCRRCEASQRRCVRCDALVPRAGCRVANGVACPSCAVYFRPAIACDGCGKPSRRLSTPASHPEEGRLCDACRNRASHATCSHCRRYRPRAGFDEAGKPYCASCCVSGSAHHACPGCGVEVSGRGNGQCRACLNSEQLRRECQIAIFSLDHAWAQDALRDFADWLWIRIPGEPKVVGMFRTSLPFFERLNAAFTSRDDIRPSTLLDHFTVSGLRKHLLCTQFLEDRLGVIVGVNEKSDHVEQQRIEALLRTGKRRTWHSTLLAFHLWLVEKGRPARTRRLYLSNALRFLVAAAVDDVTDLTDALVVIFLKKTPGARNNLSVFIGYVREATGHKLTLPSRDALSKAEPAAVGRLRSVLRQIDGFSDGAPLELLERAIAIAFGLRRRALQDARWRLDENSEQLVLVGPQARLTIPSGLARVARQWSALRGPAG